jgi:hypothetical protein
MTRTKREISVMDVMESSSLQSITWERMRSGDRPGLQNRRAAGYPVTGGFDPHSLPPFIDGLQEAPATSLTKKTWAHVECAHAELPSSITSENYSRQLLSGS